MAQVTIHKEPGVVVEVIDGFPPVDQTALVAEQAGQIVALKAALDSEAQSASAAREALAVVAVERNELAERAAAAVYDRDVLAKRIAAFKDALSGLLA